MLGTMSTAANQTQGQSIITLKLSQFQEEILQIRNQLQQEMCYNDEQKQNQKSIFERLQDCIKEIEGKIREKEAEFVEEVERKEKQFKSLIDGFTYEMNAQWMELRSKCIDLQNAQKIIQSQIKINKEQFEEKKVVQDHEIQYLKQQMMEMKKINQESSNQFWNVLTKVKADIETLLQERVTLQEKLKQEEDKQIDHTLSLETLEQTYEKYRTALNEQNEKLEIQLQKIEDCQIDLNSRQEYCKQQSITDIAQIQHKITSIQEQICQNSKKVVEVKQLAQQIQTKESEDELKQTQQIFNVERNLQQLNKRVEWKLDQIIQSDFEMKTQITRDLEDMSYNYTRNMEQFDNKLQICERSLDRQKNYFDQNLSNAEHKMQSQIEKLSTMLQAICSEMGISLG